MRRLRSQCCYEPSAGQRGYRLDMAECCPKGSSYGSGAPGMQAQLPWLGYGTDPISVHACRGKRRPRRPRPKRTRTGDFSRFCKRDVKSALVPAKYEGERLIRRRESEHRPFWQDVARQHQRIAMTKPQRRGCLQINRFQVRAETRATFQHQCSGCLGRCCNPGSAASET